MKKAGDNEKNDAGLPRGREGGKLRIDLPFEEAIRAALETTPHSTKKPKTPKT